MFERLKQKWGVSVGGVVVILIVFALAGLTVVRIREPLMGFLLPSDAPTWVKWTIYSVTILPIHYACLIVYGTLLGQGRFFVSRLKAMGRLFTKRTNP